MRRSTTMILAGVASLAAGSGLVAPAAQAARPAATPAATACTALTVLRTETLEQRVGQIFMVGTPATGASSQLLSEISSYHVGNAFLSGRSTSGTATPAHTTAALRARVSKSSTDNVPLFIATDQEGGAVQVLQGSGFSTIPAALTQGSWASSTLQSSATTWARQLAGVGVNLNLAPVADTVPSAAAARNNPPIGVYQREYGYTSYATTAGSTAFLRGMTAGGVGSTTKHFPGLGVVTANTDTSYGVHDRSTSSSSAYLNPFKADIQQGATAVMMSSAIYDKIDPSTLGVFSPKVVGLVRSAGFTGPIMTDDLGNAVQPGRWPAANRALDSLYAGVDMILTVNSSVLPTMYDAVLSRAQTQSYWLQRVNNAAYLVLLGKERRGLLTNSCSS
ncbi:glycoside hydrolase family 3 protein [Allobranchiibius huperziae]|uniref:beta-N-acetylhexosaminidase n=1 Tax=Allobranchiibius huperziae TaxID=1874116 RepID=A0A853DB37_9MICO|nr:glycoside hydrolase family 3 protein [Allobranchiibius huperziae]NYJ74756.1 beta-N-acetylhexosaminidase [Allobranchiibius huperziae]